MTPSGFPEQQPEPDEQEVKAEDEDGAGGGHAGKIVNTEDAAETE